MQVCRTYFHPYIEENTKIGNDNRSADTSMLSDDELKKEINRVKVLSNLQEKLYNKEMVKHEFIGSYRRQKTTYSDGTTVTVDLDSDTYEIGVL